MKELLTAFCVIFSGVLFAAPYVTNVVAKQRSPWGIVDISCEVAGIEEETNGLSFIVEAVLPDSSVKKVSSVRFRRASDQTRLSVTANGNYQFVWNANADLDAARYTNMLMRVSIIRPPTSVQLWQDGPYWATTNIGAEKPEEYGYYFWWGDTVGYKCQNDKWVASDGSNANFEFGTSNIPTYNKSKSTLQSEGWITTDGVLALEHDAAAVRWGNGWRMPTKNELDSLKSNCDWKPVSTNGVNGYVVRGRGDYATNSIFFPCGGYCEGIALRYQNEYGYCWSSLPSVFRSTSSYCFDCGEVGEIDGRIAEGDRRIGRNIRPVQRFIK